MSRVQRVLVRRQGATILGVSEFARQNCLGFCKPKTPLRDDLVAGRLVLVMIGALPQLGDLEPGHAGIITRFFLLADVDLSPFTLFYHELQQTSGLPELEHLARDHHDPTRLAFDQEISLTSRFQEYTHWHIVHQFGKDIRWEATLCRVLLKSHLTPVFQPRGVDIKIDKSCILRLVWDPKKQRDARARARGGGGDWAEVLRLRRAGPGDGSEPLDLEVDPILEEAHVLEALEGSDDEALPKDFGDVHLSEASDVGDDSVEVGVLEGAPDPVVAEAIVAVALPPPAPAAPPAPLAAPEDGGPRKLSLVIPDLGEIIWYHVRAERVEFNAYCFCSEHIKRPDDPDFHDPDNMKPRSWRKVRTALAGHSAYQGRPPGFLMAWLQDQNNHVCSWNHVHVHPFFT